MPKITFTQADGSSQDVDAKLNQSVMEAAMQNNVPGIVAECTGACACATCHVYVGKEWMDKTGSPSDMEEDMLDFAVEVKENSRLSCQIQVTEELDGLTVTVPKSQY